MDADIEKKESIDADIIPFKPNFDKTRERRKSKAEYLALTQELHGLESDRKGRGSLDYAHKGEMASLRRTTEMHDMPKSFKRVLAVLHNLQMLNNLEYVLIMQKFTELGTICGYNYRKSFAVLKPNGQEILTIDESMDSASCCCGCRGFKFLANNPTDPSVPAVEFKRNCVFKLFCISILPTKMTVQMNGVLLGYVVETRQFWKGKLIIYDADEEECFIIKGPACNSKCCTDIIFKIKSPDDIDIGSIAKKWLDPQTELVASADDFVVKFPDDLDIRMKAVLICTTVLIEVMYFGGSQSEVEARTSIEPKKTSATLTKRSVYAETIQVPPL